ncbi:hypothetical protein NDU88_001649 [Pleurodeles waltl]|uniref:Uncharacterized protein n=1 Tax=Pleurodeles waltl TaxID=8319 RepID=A0AAV7U718_PLEWA|nr:hypothetical protein NDU88_001649 [Pleurodeles waltl]
MTTMTSAAKTLEASAEDVGGQSRRNNIRLLGFPEGKRSLRILNSHYMLLYPIKLKVIYDGNTQFFEIPDKVWSWLDMMDPFCGCPGMMPGISGTHSGQKRTCRQQLAGQEESPRGGTGRVLICEDGTMAAAGD